MTQSHRQCKNCNIEFVLFTHRGATWAEDHRLLKNEYLTDEDKEALIETGICDNCPECSGRDLKSIIRCGTGIQLGGDAGVGKCYPYFDRGLGRHIRTAAHRKQVMAELGVEEASGSDDLIGMTERRERAEDEREQAYQQDVERSMSDPAARRALDILGQMQSAAVRATNNKVEGGLAAAEEFQRWANNGK